MSRQIRRDSSPARSANEGGSRWRCALVNKVLKLRFPPQTRHDDAFVHLRLNVRAKSSNWSVL
jgi:hypothetical protein